MNKMLAATVAVGTLMSGATQAEDQVYLEFVVYSVHDEAGFPATRAAAAREIESTADGFLWWKRLKGQDGSLPMSLPGKAREQLRPRPSWWRATRGSDR